MIAIFTDKTNTNIDYSPKGYFIVIKEEKNITSRFFTGIIIDNPLNKTDYELLELLYKRQPELDSRPIIIN